MKTYENFISNILTKRKKLPKEVTDLGDALYKLFLNNVRDDWQVIINEFEPKDKKNSNMLSIYIDPSDLEGATRVLSIYYNRVVKRVMICSIINSIDIGDILEFIENVTEKYSNEEKYKEFKEFRIFIPIENIYKVILELSDENYKMFLDQKKYNL